MRKLNEAKFRKLLEEERARIHREIEGVEQAIGLDDDHIGQGELADYDQHPADAASDTFEKEKDLAVRDSLRETIGRIDEALGKLERGTYGSCDRCGRDIPVGRLEAVPHAIYCVECQDIVEG